MVIKINRTTGETKIILKFNPYGKARYKIRTSIAFFDHLLSNFAEHGGFDLTITANGDDIHHLVEDVGIVLGEAIMRSFKRRKVNRYGNFLMPMDEVLSYVVVDLSGRGSLEYKVKFPEKVVSGFPVSLVKEFFRAVTRSANITLHISMKKTGDTHHMAESIFKGFGVALSQALSLRTFKKIPSTKGKI